MIKIQYRRKCNLRWLGWCGFLGLRFSGFKIEELKEMNELLRTWSRGIRWVNLEKSFGELKNMCTFLVAWGSWESD